MIQRIAMDDGIEIAVSLSGNPDGFPLILVHALGVDHSTWELVAAPLRATHRIVAIDLVGHGLSDVREIGGGRLQTIDRMADDVEQVVRGLGIETADFAGVSIGGMIGQVLGARNPAWLRRLVIMCTGFRTPPEVYPALDQRIATVRSEGMESQVELMLSRWFTPGFREQALSALDQVAAVIRTTPVEGFAAACEAMKSLDMTDKLKDIQVPTLVASGAQDAGATPEIGRAIAAAIPGARFELLDPSSHMAPIEAADQLWKLIDEFCKP